MPKSIPNSVKIAVQNSVEHIHSYYGKVETTQVQNKLVADYGILFFDIPLLENIIKGELKNAKV